MPCSGRQIVGALERMGFQSVGQRGSHVKLRRITDAGQVFTVIVPLHRELARGTLASIARQAGVSIDDVTGGVGR